MASSNAKFSAERKFDAFLETLDEEEKSLLGQMIQEHVRSIHEIQKPPTWFKYWRGAQAGIQYGTGAGIGLVAGLKAGKGATNPWAKLGFAAAGLGAGLAGIAIKRLFSSDAHVDKYLGTFDSDKKKDEPKKDEPKKDEPKKAPEPKKDEPKKAPEPKKDEPKKASTATKPTGKGCPSGKKMIFGLCRPCKGCD